MTTYAERIEIAKRPMPESCKKGARFHEDAYWGQLTPFDMQQLQVCDLPDWALNYRLGMRLDTEYYRPVMIDILGQDHKAQRFYCSAYKVGRAVYLIPNLKRGERANL